jgi:hypothetical protein
MFLAITFFKLFQFCWHILVYRSFCAKINILKGELEQLAHKTLGDFARIILKIWRQLSNKRPEWKHQLTTWKNLYYWLIQAKKTYFFTHKHTKFKQQLLSFHSFSCLSFFLPASSWKLAQRPTGHPHFWRRDIALSPTERRSIASCNNKMTSLHKLDTCLPSCQPVRSR